MCNVISLKSSKYDVDFNRELYFQIVSLALVRYFLLGMCSEGIFLPARRSWMDPEVTRS